MPLLTKIAETYALTVVGPFGGCVRQEYVSVATTPEFAAEYGYVLTIEEAAAAMQARYPRSTVYIGRHKCRLTTRTKPYKRHLREMRVYREAA